MNRWNKKKRKGRKERGYGEGRKERVVGMFLEYGGFGKKR